MAKLLNTSATNFVLENLISKARKHVVLISPYLKLNKRIKSLLRMPFCAAFHFILSTVNRNCRKAKNWLLSSTRIKLFL